MTAVPLVCLVAVAAYLLGAIPFGYFVGKARGVNVLEKGSGNIGATNVGRLLGARWGVVVFLLDFTKGALPVFLAGLLPPPSDADLPPDSLRVVAGIAAFLGHLFPVYLGFRGGKGVATGAGVIAVLVPALTAIVLAVWGVVVLSTRYVSLASLIAASLLFGLRIALYDAPWERDHLVITLFCLVGAILVILRHHANIRRLLSGTEHRL